MRGESTDRDQKRKAGVERPVGDDKGDSSRTDVVLVSNRRQRA